MMKRSIKNFSRADADTFVECARHGNNLMMLEMLDKHGPAILDAQSSYGWTALMLAAFRDRKDTVALLLEKGASVDIQDEDGQTALRLAEVFNQSASYALLRPYAEDRKKQKDGEEKERRAAHLVEFRMKRLKEHRPENPFSKTSPCQKVKA